MNSSNFKGALLEYIVRRLLANCGFTPVIADDLYTFENGGLLFINGKGAAHDADVLMEPPVQMPFTYPSRVLFECKAYNSTVGLSIIRNVLGLRYDINEFEIVTKSSIDQRRDNTRATYAVEERNRYHYQVGVAAVGKFSKPAIEFAANNKISLLSLTWFFDSHTLDLFHSIDENYLESIHQTLQSKIYKYLKDGELGSNRAPRHVQARDYLHRDQKIGAIITSFESVISKSYIGLIETGDLIFLFPKDSNSINQLNEIQSLTGLKAQIHYYLQEPDIWLLSISRDFDSERIAEFRFFIPARILNLWKEYSLDKSKALDIKQEYFSRIFIFNRRRRPELPFFIANIDREWLENLRSQ